MKFPKYSYLESQASNNIGRQQTTHCKYLKALGMHWKGKNFQTSMPFWSKGKLTAEVAYANNVKSNLKAFWRYSRVWNM